MNPRELIKFGLLCHGEEFYHKSERFVKLIPLKVEGIHANAYNFDTKAFVWINPKIEVRW